VPSDAPQGLCPRCLLRIPLVEAALVPSHDFLKPLNHPGERIGRYKLLQQIGEGSCGVVFMAEQEDPVRRRVALKILKVGLETRQVIARFEAERQALALMDHPAIARVLDAGSTETGRPYFVMELVRGIKITEFCDEDRVPTEERLKLFIQVCLAVQHAHQKGIIHRDLKPSNILVTVNDNAPVPKVIDFGIAKATQGRLTDQTLFTAFDQFLGTPAYMSPEQAAMTSIDVDTRSDIYSLGVLLYELLTGKTPFDSKELLAAGLDELRRTIREKEPLRPSTRLGTMLDAERTTAAKRRHTDPPRLIHLIRGDLDWIVMMALEKDRARRYPTANALAADVQRHLDSQAVTARPPSSLYFLRKAVRRHRAAFASVLCVLTVLLAGIVVSTTQAIRATRAEYEQIRLREEAEQARANERQLRLVAEASAKITHARFLFRNRDRAGSEKELAAVVPLLAQLDPLPAAKVYAQLGGALASQRKWAEAALNYTRAVEGNPGYFEDYHWLIPTLLQTGATDEYYRLRPKLLARFGDSSDPRVAERIVKDCLVLPWPDGDQAALLRLANVAVNGTSNHWAWGYFQFAKGLAEYRQGNYGGATEWMRGAVSKPEEDILRTVQAYMVLAMASHRLQRADEARQAFQAGTRVAAGFPSPDADLTDVPGWNDLIFAQILMREATDILGERPFDSIK
jgi:serine/threonine protein kinase/tetratricopeptide (TPR) repeat protein